MRLKLEHVDYIYEEGTITETAALHDINLSIEQGEMVALIGHGGSGKSTLALMMAGLVAPSHGSISLSNDIQHDPNLFRSVGMVFQYPEQQMFGETVFEEVAFGPRNYGMPEDFLPARVRQSLEEVGLDADTFWHRSPFMLSGGQKRRVCIAGVLAFNPRMLIFDEPSAGLDEAGRCWLSALIHRLNGEGRTVIWITHNMEEAAEHARRIIVLDHGHIVLDGTPQQVFAEEDILQQAHLSAPCAARLVRELRKRGADVPGTAVTIDQAHQEILDWLQHKDDKKLSPQELIDAAELALLRSKQHAGDETGLSDNAEIDPDESWEQQTVDELRALIKNSQSATSPANLAQEDNGIV